MGLAKYTAILLVPPLLVFFALKKRYDILFSPYMFLAAVIALLMITPVVYWNAVHDFASFNYQGAHVFGSLTKGLENFFVSLAAQFGAYSPFLFLVAVYGFFRALKAREDELRLAVLFGATIMIFFLATSVSEKTLPHWPSIFYLLFIPVGTFFLVTSAVRWKRNFLYIGVGLSLLVLLLIYAELAGKFVPFPDYRSPFRDIYGYPEILARADEAVKQNPSPRPKALVVMNWTMGSRVRYYNLPYGHDVFVFDFRPDQFDIWQTKSMTGYDLLFLNTHFDRLDVGRFLRCDSVADAGQMNLEINGKKVNRVEYIWCGNYQGIKKWKRDGSPSLLFCRAHYYAVCPTPSGISRSRISVFT
jgi:uncharacterized membrane protein